MSKASRLQDQVDALRGLCNGHEEREKNDRVRINELSGRLGTQFNRTAEKINKIIALEHEVENLKTALDQAIDISDKQFQGMVKKDNVIGRLKKELSHSTSDDKIPITETDWSRQMNAEDWTDRLQKFEEARDPEDGMDEAREWNQDNSPDYDENDLGWLMKVREGELRALRIDFAVLGEKLEELKPPGA